MVTLEVHRPVPGHPDEVSTVIERSDDFGVHKVSHLDDPVDVVVLLPRGWKLSRCKLEFEHNDGGSKRTYSIQEGVFGVK